MSKGMTALLKLDIFDSFDPISIILFLFNFKLACDTNGKHEDAANWLSNFFMKKPTSAVLNTKLASKRKGQTGMPSVEKTTKLSSYPQDVT